jgi:uncharacterized Ntn-hydrolase superfamily protein
MTYSIVARDPETGALGVGVQSAYFAAGGVVPWLEAGVGAVATQSIVDIGYGPKGLDSMRAGTSASETLQRLVSEDPMEGLRQVAMIDANGDVAVHTGAGCVGHAGHRVGENVSVQANMMLHDVVPDEMIHAFERATGPLAWRILAALQAAQDAGGDARGQQAAGIVVVDGERSDEPWNHVTTNVRVDDHPEPITELRRVLTVSDAAGAMASTFPLLFAPSFDGARDELEAALETLSDVQDVYGDGNLQPTYWRAMLLAKDGRIDDARALVDACVASHEGWAAFVTSVRNAGILPTDPPDLVDQLLR